MCNVFIYVVAVVFIQHGLNDKCVPWQYGMVVKLQRLGREWKNNLPFNIYAKHLDFITTDLICDNANGHWKSTCFLNLNSKPNQRLGDEYMIKVEIIVAEMLYDRGASNKMIEKLGSICIHRRSSTIRYIRDKGEQNGLEVDKEMCDSLLRAHESSKKNGTTMAIELANLSKNAPKSVSVSSSSVDDHSALAKRSKSKAKSVGNGDKQEL